MSGPTLVAGFLRRLAIAAAAIVLFAQSAAALDPSRALTQYVHRVWRTEDGLPQTSVVGLAQTPDGYMWFATTNGLVRFDGVKLKVFDRTNTPQLRDNAIDSLRTDRNGTLWIGTAAGVTLYQGGRFLAIGPARGLRASGPVYSLYESHKGEMWIGFAGLVVRHSNGKFREYKLPVTNDILAFAELGDDLWIASYGGLLRLHDDQVTRFGAADGLPNDSVLSVAAAGNELWIGTQSGVARWHDGAFHRDVPERLRAEETWVILRDREGVLWFGTRHGLLRLRGETVDTYTAADGLSNDYLVSLLEDREGSLWIGTQLDGVNLLHGGAFTTWSKAEGLGADVVWSVREEPGTGTWIGTEGGGLYLLKDGKLQGAPSPEGLTSKTIMTTARTADGTLLVGTWDHGLYRFRDGRWTNVTKKDGLGDDTVTTLEVAGPVVWVGTAHGLTRIEGGRMTNFAVRDGLPGEYIVGTHADRQGRFWVATDAGLCRFDGTRFVDTLGTVKLPRFTSYCIHEDEQGTVWFGLRNGLFSISASGVATPATSRAPLLQGKIWHIEQDRDGDFWLSCIHGVFYVPRDLMRRGQVGDPVYLGLADGMKSAACTIGVYPSTWAASDGTIWFPTTRGAARLDPKLAKRSSVAVPVRIEEVVVDQSPHEQPSTPLDVGPGAEKLEFHYTAPSFLAPEHLQFHYQLEGYDHGWIDAGDRRVAYYTHIPPGRYSFRVKVTNGAESSEAALPMMLEPRFAQTVWFWLIWALAGVLVLFGLYRLRMRTVRAKYAAVLEERNRIAREFHDTVAQGLAGLSFRIEEARSAVDDGDGKSAHEVLDVAGDLAKRCLTETRRALLDLRDASLDEAGLASAIMKLADDVREQTGLAVNTSVSGQTYALAKGTEQNILRIVQEATTNAARHSGASELAVALQFRRREIEVSISDNGSGVFSDDGHSRGGLGLVGIVERTNAIGGQVTVGAKPGQGTTVRLVVPRAASSLRERITAKS